MSESSPGSSGASSLFAYSHRVTYADCTAGNHVYYGRYLDLLEAARGAFFRHLGTSFTEQQVRENIFPAVECHLRYKRPAHYDECLRIEVGITRAAGVRLNFGYRILNPQGSLVLEGETWHVCTGLSGKPKRLPEDLVRSLQPFVRAS